MGRVKFYAKILLLAGIFLNSASYSALSQTNGSLDLKYMVDQSPASDAFWAVAVRDSSGKILEACNHEKLIRPASNLKLLTSAAILDELGSGFTYKTFVYGTGHQEQDTWKGDIIIRGTGDPSISGTFYDKYRFFVFEQFYRALDSLGIRKIEGNLIGNDSYLDQQPYPRGWSWEDLSFYYGVETSALSFNNNAVDLQVFADDEVGETPRIQWFPFDTDYVEFINEQIITPSNTQYDEFYRRISGTNTIILRSALPEGYYEEESLSVMDASLFFMDTFKKYLENGGMKLTGQIIIDNRPRDWSSSRFKILAVHESEPLGSLLKQVNTESSNFYTEMLLKTAAAEAYHTQGSTDLGISLVMEFAHRMGLDTTDVEMDDGSGMSPSTLITPADLTRLLVKMQAHPEFDTYKQSLAIGGAGGSLQHRFYNTPLVNRVFGKTGYLSGVRALSGYLKTFSGKTVIFSIFTNNYSNKTSYIDSLHESLLMKVYKAY